MRRSPGGDVGGDSIACRIVLAVFVPSRHLYICGGMVVRDRVVKEVSGLLAASIHGVHFAVAFVSRWRLLCGGIRFVMAFALRWC